MIKILKNISVIALSLLCISCVEPAVPENPKKPDTGQENGGTENPEKPENPENPEEPESQDILKKARAAKVINPYDETKERNPRHYKMSGINYKVVTDRREGTGAYDLSWSFKGKSSGKESVWFEETCGDFRSDLSLEPLGLCLWVKGNSKNKGFLRFVLMEDEKMFTEGHAYDYTRLRWQYYAYEDHEILKQDGWHQLVIPYSAFKVYKKGIGVTSTAPVLNRFAGYRIEIVNEDNKPFNGGSLKIDELKQLTAFEVKPNKAKFESIFIQLHHPSYDGTNWGQQFRDSKDIDINTWIIQACGQYGDEKISFYTGSKMNWTKQIDYIDRMFEAARVEGMKLILGLYPGSFKTYNSADKQCYDQLYNQNKACFDELYAKFGNNPCLAGWYIAEEFHDGYGMWQQRSGLEGLAAYYERVASYIKTKSNKPVLISPALWRGMPADLTGKWFDDFFFMAPSIDCLYLQDCGGRMSGSFFLTDADVDLPNWYAEIKKACEKNNVQFGVDLESFRQDTYGPRAWIDAKTNNDVKSLLQTAGMFTEHITNFSWVTFKKGTVGYNGYKSYLKQMKN